MPNTIFVPIDFSPYTAQQLWLAKNWALWLHADISVVHQMDDPIPSLAPNTVRLQIHYENKRRVTQDWFRLQKKIFDKNDFVKFDTINENLIQYLSEKTQFLEGGIIIMGLKGVGRLKQIFLGSMVTEVVEKLHQTVIAAPKNNLNITPKRLVISAHPKYHFNMKSLKILLGKIEGLVEEINLIAFAEENDEILKLEVFLEGLKSEIKTDVPIFYRIFTGDKLKNQAFDELVATQNTYLILQKGGRTFKDKIFRKFMINELVYHASIPLIILP
jgi:nucleotide-binding universal stress UspA family protein